MGIIRVFENAAEALPKEHVAGIEERIQWDGHEAEAWLAPRDVLVVGRFAKDMCREGCKIYGTSPMCPPNLPDVEEVRKEFEGYDVSLFVRYNGFHRWKDRESLHAANSLQELLPEDRRELRQRKGLRLKIRDISNYLEFLGYDTLPMSAGHCRLCEPPSCNQAQCRHPDITMPAMEGMGVHVFDTMARLGHEMHYLPPDYNSFSFYSAILINTKPGKE